jgi:hypothetical protein
MSLTFLTPVAGAVAVGALLPLVAAVAGGRRVERVGRALGLGAPPADRLGLALLAAVPLVLALAATQPALTRHPARHVRTDAAVFVVIDVSRSMLASASPGASTRLERARAAAIRIRGGLPDAPVGLATFTDRVVPLLFPTPDEAAFDSTVRTAVRSETPPPLELEPTATSFDALGALGTQGFFSDAQHHRVVVLLTDGESQPFDAATIGADLGEASLVVVRFWSAGERVYDGKQAEAAYRPDPASAGLVDELASATAGRAFEAGALGAATAAARRDLGSGRSAPAAGGTRQTPLGPWVALVALLPLGLLASRRLLAAV